MDMGPCPKHLEDEDAKATIATSVSEVTQASEVLELSKQIKEKLKKADQYAEGYVFSHVLEDLDNDLEGKTDLKIRALEEVEELRTKRADKQSTLLLGAFNKDRPSLPQPLPNPPSLAPLPVPAPDPRTQEMINEKLKKAENLGEKGMVDEAQKALEEAEALKKLSARQEPVLDSSKYTAADVRITDQKLRVCDICGAFLSVYDRKREIRATNLICMMTGGNPLVVSPPFSFGKPLGGEGGVVISFLLVVYGSKERSRDHERESSRDRDRGRDYDRRSRDQDRYSDRDHDRDYERSWTYDSRSSHRSRLRSTKRSRDHDRHRRDRY
ncbi:hypothetical protein SLEP1_g51942 [Rubroshorea leprosula]|uniref:LUC7 related protein n=1 Tax=Rubroshorea leprosula TaxID=152421 RepID=A0AAV5M4U3_9ROSI|nr:hypothetical protein SLEP1_g51942 [Rubroshorea leprosula]